jgi:antitoxin YefM
MEKVTYSYTRENLNSILNQISNNSEIFCIERRNGKDVIMIDKDDYNSLLETAYILKSPKNAKQLFKALEEADKNIGDDAPRSRATRYLPKKLQLFLLKGFVGRFA